MDPLTSIAWLVILTVILLWTKAAINLGLQQIMLWLFGDASLAITLYFILMLPGILVHEFSHWGMAKLLGVRTGKIRLGPRRLRGGRMSLGSIMVARTDPLRDSLIGIAPLLSGTAIVLFLANWRFGVSLAEDIPPLAQLGNVLQHLTTYTQTNDVWVWLYLMFAISNSMLPSESDRTPWRSLGVWFALLGIGYVFAFGVPRVPPELIELAQRTTNALTFGFGLAMLVDLFFLALIWGLNFLMRWWLVREA